MHGINTKCLQWGNSEVLECISHESHIDYIVQLVVFTPCLENECVPQFDHVFVLVLWHHLTLHIIDALLARGNDSVVQCVVRFDEAVEYGFLPCQQINVLILSFFSSRLAILAQLFFGVHVEVQIPSKCLSRNGTQWTADQFQRVLELNAIVLDLHFLVFCGWNDFQISRYCRDELHDVREIIVRPIVKVH